MSLLWSEVSADVDDKMSRGRPHRHCEVSCANARVCIADRHHHAVRDRLASGEVQRARDWNRRGIWMNGQVARTRGGHCDHVVIDCLRESGGDAAIRCTSLSSESTCSMKGTESVG